MANQGLVRRINRARVLDAIRRHRPISRSALADRLELDRKSITNLVSELLRDGLVVETGTVRAERGRPLTMLALRPDTHWAGGMSVQADAVSGVLLDVGGERRWTAHEPLAAGGALEAVVAAVQGIYARMGEVAEGRLRGVGLAVPGIVDTVSGEVRRSVNLPVLEGAGLRQLFGGFVREPLHLEENSRAKALAEKWFGAAREVSSFVCVDLGMGIGAGLVQDRRLYAPAGGYAGEIGHVRVDPDGPPCRCGRRGCLEACISERVLVQRVREAGDGGCQRLADVRDPGPAVRAVLEEAGYRLGLALAYVVNILCPPLIVLNGSLVRCAEVVMPAVERGLREAALAECLERVRLEASMLSEAEAVGAASRVLSEVYEVDGHVQV